MTDDRLTFLEARRVLGRLPCTDLQPVAHEFLADGYDSDALIELVVLSADEVPWRDGEALLERGLRELGTEPLTREDAALVFARDESRRALQCEVQPFDLVCSVGRLGFVDEIWVEELKPLADIYARWAFWGEEIADAKILDAARALLAEGGAVA